MSLQLVSSAIVKLANAPVIVVIVATVSTKVIQRLTMPLTS